MDIYRDYRKSHTGLNKGQEYDKSFNEIPYRKYLWTWEKQILRHVIDTYCKTPENYLDFACGTGRIISFLEPMVVNAYGVDISDSMLKIANKKVKKASLVNIDLTKESYFQEKFFDMVTAFRFFQNAQQELRIDAFNVIEKLIKENGIFIFNIHNNSSSMKTFLKRIKHSINKSNNRINIFGVKDINKMTAEHGFEILDTFHYGVLPIKESLHLPMDYISAFEKRASQMNCFKSISNNLIFVCKRV